MSLNDIISYGEILCPAYKCGNIIYMNNDKLDYEKGFLTESGDFVNPIQALEVANFYNQVINKHEPHDRLLLEDLQIPKDVNIY